MAKRGRGDLVAAGDSLTAMQAAFVRAYVLNGGRQTDAAREAGYQDPGARAWELMRLPHVRAAIDESVAIRCEEGRAVAMATLIEVAREGSNENARVSAAKALATIGGLVKPQQTQDMDKKPLSDMDVDELAAFIGKARAALAVADGRVIEVEAITIPEQSGTN